MLKKIKVQGNEKFKERGITLVALIITVVIILIIATVAVQPIRDEGIIDTAKDAKNSWELSGEKDLIGRAVVTATTVNRKGKITVKTLQKTLDGEARKRKNYLLVK